MTLRPRLVPSTSRTVPLRVELESIPIAPGLDDARIDLTMTVRRLVSVVDSEGVPAPAAIAVGTPRPVSRVDFTQRFATDVSGRAELWLPPSPRVIYATNRGSHAFRLFTPGESVGPMRLQLEPIPRMRFRVIDTEGQPVSDAHVIPQRSSGAMRFEEPAREMERIISEHLWSGYARGARSAADGVIEIPVFLRGGATAYVEIQSGTQRSMRLRLAPGDQPDVVLR